MNKNTTLKIFVIVILTVIVTIAGSSNVYALSIGNIINGADNFVNSGKEGDAAYNTTAMRDTISDIYNVLLVLGTVVAVIVGMILGIQFITGSVEQKSKIKEAVIPYVVGCIVVFGAFGIWRLVIIILR